MVVWGLPVVFSLVLRHSGFFRLVALVPASPWLVWLCDCPAVRLSVFLSVYLYVCSFVRSSVSLWVVTFVFLVLFFSDVFQVTRENRFLRREILTCFLCVFYQIQAKKPANYLNNLPTNQSNKQTNKQTNTQSHKTKTSKKTNKQTNRRRKRVTQS